MTLFIWVVLMLFILDSIVKIHQLAIQSIPLRTPTDLGIDVIVNLSVMLWAVYLLGRG